MLGAVSINAVLSEELSSIKATHFGLCVCLQLSGVYLSNSVQFCFSPCIVRCLESSYVNKWETDFIVYAQTEPDG